VIQEEDKRWSIGITDHELEADQRRGDKVEKCEREKVWANSGLRFSLSLGRRSGKQVGSGSLEEERQSAGEFSLFIVFGLSQLTEQDCIRFEKRPIYYMYSKSNEAQSPVGSMQPRVN